MYLSFQEWCSALDDTMCIGRRDGSVGKAVTLQAGEPEVDHQHLHKNRGVALVSVITALRMQRQDNLWGSLFT